VVKNIHSYLLCEVDVYRLFINYDHTPGKGFSMENTNRRS